MQKISPLRSSIEAFNKFKALRANKTEKNEKTQNDVAKAQTNPFGITFKGNIIQMDVFEKTDKTDKTNNEVTNTSSLKEKMQNTGKLLASAWVGTINKFSSLKANAIAFGNKIKDSTIAAAKKIQEIGNTKIELDSLNPFKYSVSNLQNQPVGELRTLLTNELQGAY